MHYSLLREFADSWVLLALFAVFVGAIAWTWRPGARALHDDAARSIFREAGAPRADQPPTECGRGCTCAAGGAAR